MTVDSPRRRCLLGRMEFYRILDSLPSWWHSYYVTLALTGLRLQELCELRSESLDHDTNSIQVKDGKALTGIRTIYVAQEFWPHVMASVPMPVKAWDVRDQWAGAVERAGLMKMGISELRRLRGRLLAEARHRPGVRLLGDQTQEDARLLTQLLPVLTLTEYKGRRLLLRRVP